MSPNVKTLMGQKYDPSKDASLGAGWKDSIVIGFIYIFFENICIKNK